MEPVIVQPIIVPRPKSVRDQTAGIVVAAGAVKHLGKRRRVCRLSTKAESSVTPFRRKARRPATCGRLRRGFMPRTTMQRRSA